MSLPPRRSVGMEPACWLYSHLWPLELGVLVWYSQGRGAPNVADHQYLNKILLKSTTSDIEPYPHFPDPVPNRAPGQPLSKYPLSPVTVPTEPGFPGPVPTGPEIVNSVQSVNTPAPLELFFQRNQRPRLPHPIYVDASATRAINPDPARPCRTAPSRLPGTEPTGITGAARGRQP